MAKWLDKYEQGGLVLKKKTKDNYGKKPNVNDVKVSAGPDFVGDGYTAYNWKSPAWGGQFAMGGSLPGSVGFMYARTQNPAPANGKYTKKTLASAQFGMELMPYMAQAAVAVKNAIPTIEEVKTKATDVIKKSPTARKLANKVVSAVANSDWGKEKLKNFARNIDPRGYGLDSEIKSPFDRAYSAAILNKKEKAREEFDRDLATPGKAQPSDSVRVDLINKYAGLPEKFGTLKPSAYTPSVGNKNEKYFSSPQIERTLLSEINQVVEGNKLKGNFKTKADLENFVANHFSSRQQDPRYPDDPSKSIPVKGKGNNYVTMIEGLGSATVGIGEDERGPYLSYYDNWDLNPYYGSYAEGDNSFESPSDKLGRALVGNEKEDVATKHIGNPTKMYGRIYFDKKTGKPKMQNGGEMEYYQNGLDFKPKSISKKGKKIVKDDRGQWAHPGEITEISSPDITMQGVDYPVLGISDTGDTQMMYPDQDYKFDGKKVTEYPIMQEGGWLNKYDNIPATSLLKKQAEEFLAKRNANRNTISQYTPKPGEQERFDREKLKRIAEENAPLNKFARSKASGNLQDAAIFAADVMTLGEAAALTKPALKAAAKYATEKTALKNAYKLNPYAFKPTEGMMYRGLGKEGMEDALESGVFRAKQDVKPIMHGPFDFSKQFNKAYFSPQFDVADRYGKGFIAEVPRDATTWGNRYSARNNWSQIAQEDIPITEGKILQKDWLKGYKPIPQQLSSQSVTRGPIPAPYKGTVLPYDNIGYKEPATGELAPYITPEFEPIPYSELPKTIYHGGPKVIPDVEAIQVTREGLPIQSATTPTSRGFYATPNTWMPMEGSPNPLRDVEGFYNPRMSESAENYAMGRGDAYIHAGEFVENPRIVDWKTFSQMEPVKALNPDFRRLSSEAAKIAEDLGIYGLRDQSEYNILNPQRVFKSFKPTYKNLGKGWEKYKTGGWLNKYK